jgi:hypothetical protein
MLNKINKGQNARQVTDRNTAVDPFVDNFGVSLVYRRAERLVSATFMVTNHITNDEQLKRRIRDNASDLLVETMELRDGLSSTGSDSVLRVVARVRLILSHIDILHVSGLISELNACLLRDAYTSFVQNLTEISKTNSGEGVDLKPDFFDVSGSTVVTTQLYNNNDNSFKNNTSFKKSTNDNEGDSLSSKVHRNAQHKMNTTSKEKKRKKTYQNKDNRRLSTEQRAYNANMQSKLSSRQKLIIDIVSKKGIIGIGDITRFITDCSTKTIQRDLLKMVDGGVLKRSGEKRWTQYELSNLKTSFK